jgi:hypothetical protein
MLHFMPNNPYALYIGMCDWGEIRHLQEVIHLHTNFQKK